MANLKKLEKFMVTVKVLYVIGKGKIKFNGKELDYLWMHGKDPSTEHLTNEQLEILKAHEMVG